MECGCVEGEIFKATPEGAGRNKTILPLTLFVLLLPFCLSLSLSISGPSLPYNKLDNISSRIELCVLVCTRVAYDSAALPSLATCSTVKVRDTDEVNIRAS